MPDEIYVRYIGKGIYLSGVPTRDMIYERWERIPQALRDKAIQMGLYEIVEKKSKAHKYDTVVDESEE